jgi:phospholipase/carboxylesterase
VTNASLLERPHIFLAADPASTAPPLLLLHGTGGSEHDLLPLRDLLTPGAAVLAVRGTVEENGMNRFFRRIREGVFDEVDLRRQADDLAAFIEVARSAYELEDQRLLAVGFSNGANMASALLLQHPELLVGAVLLSAMVPFAEPPEVDLTGRLVVVSNGDRDPMIPTATTDQLVRQLRNSGADVRSLEFPGGHQLSGAVLPEIRRLIDGLSPLT